MPHAEGVEETKYLLVLGKDLGYIQAATHAMLAEEYDLKDAERPDRLARPETQQ
jgi:hypothetical protein